MEDNRSIGRETTKMSPYNYTINNPIRYLDPDGRDVFLITGGARFTGQEPKIAFVAIKRHVERI